MGKLTRVLGAALVGIACCSWAFGLLLFGAASWTAATASPDAHIEPGFGWFGGLMFGAIGLAPFLAGRYLWRRGAPPQARPGAGNA